MPGDEPDGAAGRPALVAALNERVVTPSLRSAPAEKQQVCHTNVAGTSPGASRLLELSHEPQGEDETREGAYRAGLMCEDWRRC